MYNLYHICIFINCEDDLFYLLLEHQYLTTPARHLYLASWFLSFAFLGDQCLFLAYTRSINVRPCVGSHRMSG